MQANNRGYILLEMLTAVAILALLSVFGLKLFTFTVQASSDKEAETLALYRTAAAVEWFRSSRDEPVAAGHLIWLQDQQGRVEIDWLPWSGDAELTAVEARYYLPDKEQALCSLFTLCCWEEKL